MAEYTYDAYGNLTDMSGSQAADNPIRFSTKYFDSNTGYYDFGFRSYDPVTGRWLNRDPIGEDGGLNLYGFVGNSPGNIFDEYGLADRSGKGAGQVINYSRKFSILVLFDTDARVTGKEIVWKLWVPPGYETNPAHTDVDYIKPNIPGIPWKHLAPNGNGAKGGGLAACRVFDGPFGIGIAPGAPVRPYHNPEWMRLIPPRVGTEGIDTKTGLPQDLLGSPPRPVKEMPLSMAKGWGFIRKIK